MVSEWLTPTFDEHRTHFDRQMEGSGIVALQPLSLVYDPN
jgi:hypothetical protein